MATLLYKNYYAHKSGTAFHCGEKTTVSANKSE